MARICVYLGVRNRLSSVVFVQERLTKQAASTHELGKSSGCFPPISLPTRAFSPRIVVQQYLKAGDTSVPWGYRIAHVLLCGWLTGLKPLFIDPPRLGQNPHITRKFSEAEGGNGKKRRLLKALKSEKGSFSNYQCQSSVLPDVNVA